MAEQKRSEQQKVITAIIHNHGYVEHKIRPSVFDDITVDDWRRNDNKVNPTPDK